MADNEQDKAPRQQQVEPAPDPDVNVVRVVRRNTDGMFHKVVPVPAPKGQPVAPDSKPAKPAQNKSKKSG